MDQEFCKYHGTGNDFIMIHDPASKFPRGDYELIKRLCERRFGIGADGLIVLEKDDMTDFRMHYFNADGREGSMCGNGGRCAVAFAYRMELCSEAATFIAIDGTHVGKILENGLVQIKMQSVNNIRVREDHYELDTGSPHYVTFVKDASGLDVFSLGKKIRYSNAFRADGINVNFVEESSGRLFVRTYERGVENETFSCGTGVVASAICASLRDPDDRTDWDIRTRGGNLKVTFRKEEDNHYRNIILEGPAEFIYKGQIEI